jgi:hypothetical protein
MLLAGQKLDAGNSLVNRPGRAQDLHTGFPVATQEAQHGAGSGPSTGRVRSQAVTGPR